VAFASGKTAGLKTFPVERLESFVIHPQPAIACQSRNTPNLDRQEKPANNYLLRDFMQISSVRLIPFFADSDPS
jgi:hypothetical protein